MRTFTETTFIIRVLSEQPIPEDFDLDDVLYQCTHGDYVSSPVKRTEERLTPDRAALRLIEFDSDPSFFGLTDDGEEAGT